MPLQKATFFDFWDQKKKCLMRVNLLIKTKHNHFQRLTTFTCTTKTFLLLSGGQRCEHAYTCFHLLCLLYTLAFSNSMHLIIHRTLLEMII